MVSLFAPVYDEYSPFVDDEGYIMKKLENGTTKDHSPRGLSWLVIDLESHMWVNDGSTAHFQHDDDTTGKISPVCKEDSHEAAQDCSYHENYHP